MPVPVETASFRIGLPRHHFYLVLLGPSLDSAQHEAKVAPTKTAGGGLNCSVFTRQLLYSAALRQTTLHANERTPIVASAAKVCTQGVAQVPDRETRGNRPWTDVTHEPAGIPRVTVVPAVAAPPGDGARTESGAETVNGLRGTSRNRSGTAHGAGSLSEHRSATREK